MIEVNLVCIQGWIRLLVRIPAIDPEGLDMAAVALGRPVLACADFGIGWKCKLGHFRTLLV
jgi:hypothetical protein